MRLQRCAFLLTGLLGLTFFTLDGCGGSSKKGGEGGSGSDWPDALPKPCLEDSHCPVGVCDTTRNLCVQCLEDDSCGDGSKCVANWCERVGTCQSSSQCTSGSLTVCDPEEERCVECVSDDDCGGDKVCVHKSCVDSCESDDNCLDTDYCLVSAGGCVPTVCNKDEAFCVAGKALTCDAHAAAYEEREKCTNGCVDLGKQGKYYAAQCAGPANPGGSGGGPGGGGGGGKGEAGGGGSDGQGGAPPGPGGGGSGGVEPKNDGGDPKDVNVPNEGSVQCQAPGEIDACTKVPKFTGTQTVDGLDTDFGCVPQRVINLTDAGTYKNPADYSGSPSKATLRLAWSSTALHAFVHVETSGALAQGAEHLYDGDNVQFFIAADNPSGIEPDGTKDGAANQVTIAPPASGKPAKAETRFNTSYEYKALAATGGYDVELRWPWPTNLAKPTAAGKKIGFDILIGVSGSSGTRVVEYGMYLKQSSGSCAQMYCDDSLWCIPELQ